MLINAALLKPEVNKGLYMDLAKSIRVGLAINNNRKNWLASELNVSNAYITQFCNAARTPNREMIQRISKVFDVKVSVFISWGEL